MELLFTQNGKTAGGAELKEFGAHEELQFRWLS